MAKIIVPEIYASAVRELIELPQLELEALNQAILDAGSDSEKTKAAFSANLKHGETGYDAIVSLAAARYAHGLTTAEVAAMVAESTGMELDVAIGLQRLLENQYIVHLAKRVDLATAFQYGLHKLRVFTDIRPVFDDDPTLPIEAALVTHSVKVTYVENNEFKEIYLEADLDDLLFAKGQIERAIDKAQTAETFLRKAGATVLGGSGVPS